MSDASYRGDGSERAILGELSTEAPDRREFWAKLAVILAFALYYIWDVFEAVSNLIGVLLYAATLGGQLNSFAWLVLITGILLPIVFFAAAVVVARKRTKGPTALILFVGIAAVSTLSLSLEALVRSVSAA